MKVGKFKSAINHCIHFPQYNCKSEIQKDQSTSISNCIAFKEVWQRKEKLKTREISYYSCPNINQELNLENSHRLSIQRNCGYQVVKSSELNTKFHNKQTTWYVGYFDMCNLVSVLCPYEVHGIVEIKGFQKYLGMASWFYHFLYVTWGKLLRVLSLSFFTCKWG